MSCSSNVNRSKRKGLATVYIAFLIPLSSCLFSPVLLHDEVTSHDRQPGRSERSKVHSGKRREQEQRHDQGENEPSWIVLGCEMENIKRPPFDSMKGPISATMGTCLTSAVPRASTRTLLDGRTTAGPLNIMSCSRRRRLTDSCDLAGTKF